MELIYLPIALKGALRYETWFAVPFRCVWQCPSQATRRGSFLTDTPSCLRKTCGRQCKKTEVYLNNLAVEPPAVVDIHKAKPEAYQ